MKRLIIIIAILAAAATVWAKGPLQKETGVNAVIQGFAPNGTLSTATTALISTTVDMSTYTAFALYCAADSKIRLMPTSAKGTYKQTTIPGGSYYVRIVNSATPFVNYSGACELQAQ